MAEIVEYRVDKTVDELNLLVKFGVFSKENAKDILAKRSDFEYVLRRRNKTKLDFLKYIRFEVNLLDSIEKYKKTVISDYYKAKSRANKKTEELDRRILLLQAKKLNDVLRSRSFHISSLFRKLTISFQFDRKLWLAYIDFAKSRSWNTRVTSLYWRLLRVSGDDEEIWLAAASHEINTNRAFDVARGLYLRALRHHPKSAKVWAEYFKMEVRFMEIVDQRARIVFKTLNGSVKEDAKKKVDEDDIWAEKEEELNDSEVLEPELCDEEEANDDGDAKTMPEVKPIDSDDAIISGHLPKIIYNNAADALDSNGFQSFIIMILAHILTTESETKGLLSLREYIISDILKRHGEGDKRIPDEFVENCENVEFWKERNESIHKVDSERASKRMKKTQQSRMNLLYDCYESKGIDETRILFKMLEASVKNQTLSLYVGMVQVELWQLGKEKNDKTMQLNRIRAIYDKALTKFGKTKPKLWYEYMQFEHQHAKSLDDFERMNQLYLRAQSTLDPSKVDRVIEKYTLLQVNSSNADIEYSDYSDLDD